jgi:uncharacterized membrane protein
MIYRRSQMRSIFEFLKTTALGGFFVLLPLLLLFLIISEALDLIVALATPIAALLPEGTLDLTQFPVPVAVLLLVGMSFLIGLSMRSKKGREFGQWIERTTLHRIPAYSVFKSLTQGFAKPGTGASFRPAVFRSDSGDEKLAFLVEEHINNKVTVLLPLAPATFTGSVIFTDRDKVTLIDTDLGEFTKVIGHWGVGAGDLMTNKRTDRQA